MLFENCVAGDGDIADVVADVVWDAGEVVLLSASTRTAVAVDGVAVVALVDYCYAVATDLLTHRHSDIGETEVAGT